MARVRIAVTAAAAVAAEKSTHTIQSAKSELDLEPTYGFLCVYVYILSNTD